ncbi:MAG: HDIG domain-containing protein [Candidatus Omnitrophica bacterium]|nr:HDIG domain-containing protein [Candidatus Omnitrophota bacterium]
MIKQSTKDRIKFIIGTILVFLFCYMIGLNFTIAAFLLSLIVYIKARPGLKKVNLLYLILLFTSILATAYFVINHGWSKFYIPFCAIPILTTLLFNRLELSLLMTLAISIVTASITGNHLHLGVVFFVSGLISSILVLNARRRMTIIRAGFLAGILQAMLLFFIDIFWVVPKEVYYFSYATLFFNGLASSIIALGVLPLFEYLFNTITNISLLELADFNHPLLQRMILEAPGTYHHSLIVGNLSEAACGAIGANALLARIGAYYHDIGKLEKPEYFSENQNIFASKHDTLTPSMSKLVITSHTKDGVELAKKYKLNQSIINFIRQHHGKSLVYFFYRRALESLEEDQDIKEEGFRYPGPKPDSKETAVVMLADSVEAATRALKEPSPSKISEVVHKIINNKFIDGQLDECELTLKDLEKIAAVFIRLLGGIYHSRINYPEKLKGESNNKKLPKEDSHRSENNKEGRT